MKAYRKGEANNHQGITDRTALDAACNFAFAVAVYLLYKSI